VTARRRIGDVPEEVFAAAAELGAGLAVVRHEAAARGAAPLLGGVSRALLWRSKRPVTIVRPVSVRNPVGT
jgi:hypothetical protein